MALITRLEEKKDTLMRIFTIALMLALFLGASGATLLPVRAADGDLDRSFGGYGSGGRTISQPFPGITIADAVTTPDEKLLVVGSDGQDMVIARFDAGGMLDPTFGTQGVTRLDFDNGTDTASSVALAFNVGKILVAGTTGAAGMPNTDFAVARLHADGAPDQSFSGDGKTTVDFNGRADRATTVISFFENKIILAGSVEQAVGGNLDFGFAWLNNDGSLDTKLGSGGKSQHDFGGNDTPLTLVWSSNTLYAGGYRMVGTSSEYVVSLHQYGSGKLLTSFNGTGYRTGTALPRVTDLLAVGPFADEDVVAIGDAGDDFGLIRFKEDGSPVTTWGNNGLLTIDFGGNDKPHTLSYLGDGTIAVAGSSGARLAQASVADNGQLLPDSAVTTDLGAGGEAVQVLATALLPDIRLWTIAAVQVNNTARLALTHHFLAGSIEAGGQQATNLGDVQLLGGRNNDDRARAAVFQPDGKLLVAGHTRPDFAEPKTAVLRYTVAGALDPAFDGDGQLMLDTIPKGATDIALHNGKIFVAGSTFDVARLNANGSPDTTFNGGGKAAFTISTGVSERMVIQPDGKIVLVGYTNNPATFVITRFTASGTPDPSFGLAGVQRIGVGLAAAAFAVAIQGDGKLVVAGTSLVSAAELDFALVRLNTNGSPDLSFDGDGKVTTNFGSIDSASSVAITSDGAILVGGASANNGAVFARYAAKDGALDPSFGNGGKLLLQVTGNDKVRALLSSNQGITAALCDENENDGLVLRLTPDGKLDTSVNGNGRLPFRFGGTDCPFGLANTTGRIAAVGYGRSLRPTTDRGRLSEDIAVAVYKVALPPAPPTPAPTPRPSIFVPLVRR